MSKAKNETPGVPEGVREVYMRIVAKTDDFCRTHLTDEFSAVCRKLAAKLARKRPSPMLRGRPEIWAAAIAYVVGKVNFIYDKTQTPHITPVALYEAFGAAAGTVAQKARLIQDIVDIGVMEPEYTVPSRLGDNPMAWMLSVNGFVMDIRHASRGAQEEALRRGLIPYIPAGQAIDEPPAAKVGAPSPRRRPKP